LRFRGLFPILQTPFDENGEIDYDSLRRLARYVRDHGADNFVFPGFASEWWKLSDSEIFECAEAVGKSAILNVTAQATTLAIHAAHEFQRLGAGALMILPPFVFPASPEPHLRAVMDSVDLPCIIQDSAGLTGLKLDPTNLAHPNLAAIKVDQVPTGPAVTRLRTQLALTNLSYVVGYSGVHMFDAVQRGAEGLMGCCGHIKEDRRMLDALLAGGGYEEYTRLLPLLNFEMQTLDLVIAVHKQLLCEQGVIATPLCRRPCTDLDDFQKEQLRMHLKGQAGACV